MPHHLHNEWLFQAPSTLVAVGPAASHLPYPPYQSGSKEVYKRLKQAYDDLSPTWDQESLVAWPLLIGLAQTPRTRAFSAKDHPIARGLSYEELTWAHYIMLALVHQTRLLYQYDCTRFLELVQSKFPESNIAACVRWKFGRKSRGIEFDASDPLFVNTGLPAWLPMKKPRALEDRSQEAKEAAGSKEQDMTQPDGDDNVAEVGEAVKETTRTQAETTADAATISQESDPKVVKAPVPPTITITDEPTQARKSNHHREQPTEPKKKCAADAVQAHATPTSDTQLDEVRNANSLLGDRVSALTNRLEEEINARKDLEKQVDQLRQRMDEERQAREVLEQEVGSRAWGVLKREREERENLEQEMEMLRCIKKIRSARDAAAAAAAGERESVKE